MRGDNIKWIAGEVAIDMYLFDFNNLMYNNNMYNTKYKVL